MIVGNPWNPILAKGRVTSLRWSINDCETTRGGPDGRSERGGKRDESTMGFKYKIEY